MHPLSKQAVLMAGPNQAPGIVSLCCLAAWLALPAASAYPVSKVTSDEATIWIQAHRLSEEEFVRLSQEPGTVILDTSTRETYRWLHLAGAVHLPSSELNAAGLGKLLPDKNAPVLLYENNNYQAFAKQRDAGNNNGSGTPFVGEWSGDVEYTCQVLREHGYQRVYALASYVRIDHSRLPLVAGMSAVDLDTPVALSLNPALPWLGKPLLR